MKVLAVLALLAAGATGPSDFRADARELGPMIAATYAYPEHWPGGVLPQSAALDAERDAVHDRDSLLHYAEDLIAALADHHAITGASFKDDWALVPSYADLWVEDGRITAVRADSPAAVANIVAGDRLVAIGGEPLVGAVAAFWSRLGLPVTAERRDYAQRVLAAGRRDHVRALTVEHAGQRRELTLPNLYAAHSDAHHPFTVIRHRDGGATIEVGDSLGEQTSIVGFDAIMALLPPRAPVEIDLTDTPSGGNTSVARAILGWFVRRPTGYQVHTLPSEQRETGIARQWVEQVLPRAGKYHPGPVKVRVGRWTGSMGEGLAAGFAALGARVCGGPMAGLKGAVYDVALPRSGLVVKVPAERLTTVAGVPRERWVPPPCR